MKLFQEFESFFLYSIKEAGFEEKQPIIQHIQFSLQKGEWWCRYFNVYIGTRYS
jgi:hypothetical protein